METYIGPEGVQYVHGKGTVQDGDSGIHQTHSPDRGLGNFPRFLVSIPPHPHTSSFQEVPAVCHQQPGLPIQSSADGPNFFSPHLHQGHKSYPEFSSTSRDTSTSIFRRLADQRQISTGDSAVYFTDQRVGRGARLADQRREVRTDALADDNISRIQVSVKAGKSLPHRREMGQAAEVHTNLPRQFIPHSERVAVYHRPTGVDRKDGTPGTSPSTSATAGSDGPVVSYYPVARRSDLHITGSQRLFKVVDNPGQCHGRHTLGRDPTSVPYLHGCLDPRLGRICRFHGGSGKVEYSREDVTHKCPRDAECVLCDHAVQRDVDRQYSTPSDRQQYSSSLCEEARRNKIPSTLVHNSDAVSVAESFQDRSQVPSHSREVERTGRRALETGTDSSNRMEYSPSNPQHTLADMGETVNRSVRHSTQLQASLVCVSSPGRKGVGSGCSEHGLEPPVCIRLPSDNNSGKSIAEDSDLRLRDSASGTSLAEAAVVFIPPRSSDRPPSSAPSMGNNAKATQVINLPPKSRDAPLTCVEIIQQSIEKKGFSKQASARMARPQKDSTITVYQGKWKVFGEWCVSKGVTASEADAVLVADFMLYLHEEKKLARSTIEGYRTAISHVIKAKSGLDLGHNAELSNLIANFTKESINRKAIIPIWDLSLVLLALTKGPFEPMHRAELKFITLKTVFLVALASARRRGELHALQCSIQHTSDWSEITLFTNPQFVPKTQLIGSGGGPMKPLIIKALSKSLSKDLQEDRSLCAVRAIKYYLDKTKATRQGREKFFIAYKKGYTQEICKNTISGWIKKTVLLAYKSAPKEDIQVLGVKAHDVRGLAASWALLKSSSLDDILEACSWRSQNTFSKFYLKDLTRIQDNLHRLGPVVTALHS